MDKDELGAVRHASFNSTLVQLKVEIVPVRSMGVTSFNSTLVQLKEGYREVI